MFACGIGVCGRGRCTTGWVCIFWAVDGHCEWGGGEQRGGQTGLRVAAERGEALRPGVAAPEGGKELRKGPERCTVEAEAQPWVGGS